MVSPVEAVISAYSTSNHLLVDLDGATLTQAVGIVKLIQKDYPDVSHCLLVKSSPDVLIHKRHPERVYVEIAHFIRNSYHLIFNGEIPYSLATTIIATLAELDVIARDFIFIRQWRGDMSLRVSKKLTIQRETEPPEIIGLIMSPLKYSGRNMINYYLAALETYNDTAQLFRLFPVPGDLTISQHLKRRNPYRRVLPPLRPS